MLNNLEYIEISKDNLIETVLDLKNSQEKQFNILLSVSGADYVEHLEVVYHLHSTVFNKSIALKVKLDKENLNIETLSRIYPAADWHERETYDLFGITFNNHSNLERILLPKDWIGHPLRKDYVNNDERLSWNER